VALDTTRDRIDEVATQANDIEKKLNKHLGGYKNRAGLLRQKISDASGELEEQRKILDCERTMLDLEQGPDGAINRRLSSLRDEVAFITRREREAQELYRARKEELESLQEPTNGVH
jgi:pre-mRNA-splicing factor CDC5/CEF1